MLSLCLAAVMAAAPLHLPDLLREAGAQNPELRAARLRELAARASVSPAGALDDPMLMVQLWNAPVDFSTTPIMVQLTQRIPLGAKPGLRREIAEADLGAARAEVATQARDLQADVARAYFDLFLAEQSAEVDEGLGRTLEILKKAALARLEAGLSQPVEALRIEAARIQNVAEEEVAHERATAARARLAALLDRSSTAELGSPVTPALVRQLPTLAALVGLAVNERPELLNAAEKARAAKQQIRLTEADRIPDLGLNVAGMHTFGMTGVSNFLFAGVEVNLPIFEGNKTGPRVSAAHASAEAAHEMERALRNRIVAEVAEAYAQLKAEEKAVELHHQLIPVSRQAMESALASYSAGRLDFVATLDAVRELQMHQLDLVTHLSAYEQRLVDLEHAVGADLGLLAAAEAGHAEDHL